MGTASELFLINSYGNLSNKKIAKQKMIQTTKLYLAAFRHTVNIFKSWRCLTFRIYCFSVDDSYFYKTFQKNWLELNRLNTIDVEEE